MPLHGVTSNGANGVCQVMLPFLPRFVGMRRCPPRLAAAISLAILGGCDTAMDGDPTRARSHGEFVVLVNSSGDDIPGQGFTLHVGDKSYPLPSSGRTAFPAPSRAVTGLTVDLPANCTATDSLPTTIGPSPSAEALRLEVACRWREVFLYTLRGSESSYPMPFLHYLDDSATVLLYQFESWHGSPRMSPDRRRIAFASYRRGDSQASIYVMNRDGGGTAKIADPGGGVGWSAYNIDPTWAPDGSRIAFRTVGTGSAPVEGIVIINDDGTRPTPTGVIGRELDWSPTRDEIAFVVNGHLNRLVTTTGEVQRLTDDRFAELGARWNPDGNRLLAKRAAWADGSGTELWIIDRDGSDVVRVPTGDREIGTFSWSPDGESVAYTLAPTDQGSPWEVYRWRVGDNAPVLALSIPSGIIIDDLEWH